MGLISGSVVSVERQQDGREFVVLSCDSAAELFENYDLIPLGKHKKWQQHGIMMTIEATKNSIIADELRLKLSKLQKENSELKLKLHELAWDVFFKRDNQGLANVIDVFWHSPSCTSFENVCSHLHADFSNGVQEEWRERMSRAIKELKEKR